ncbi:hypothetical protein BBAD15_g12179 [Beauveria bassiana D1-5]|uniref:RelA/SpoT domain-containing protein n=1 Tax=Beauveria bassiana D1-5 TaxID=1245745 RepID=A0A0A2VP60_BEABA|nr:hypothetical protein BBAD15_g12179 [Beauveria bassiana D1-5]
MLIENFIVGHRCSSHCNYPVCPKQFLIRVQTAPADQRTRAQYLHNFAVLPYLAGNMAVAIVEDFMESYERQFDFWARLAHLAEKQCRRALNDNGIPAIISSRAKRPDRLRDKLLKRVEEKDYKDHKDILNDVVDLAGVRVALYFPSQESQVASLLRGLFVLKKLITIPPSTTGKNDIQLALITSGHNAYTYTNQFSGYRATHLRVKLRPDGMAMEEQNRYCSSMIEIQVASLLMHAWSEVEHDLAYKTLNGDISDDEIRMLDGINGLVRTGEVMLSQLRASMEARVSQSTKPFANPFELGAFIQSCAHTHFGDNKGDICYRRMGSLSSLLYVITHLERNTPQKLGALIKAFYSAGILATNYSVVQLILCYIFNTVYDQRKSKAMSSPYFWPLLNDTFQEATETEKLRAVLRILTYASAEKVSAEKDEGIEDIDFPDDYERLREEGLILSLEKDLREFHEKEAEIFESVNRLWKWFAEHQQPHVCVSLGIGRAKQGNRASPNKVS